jgi:hypothetical protein
MDELDLTCLKCQKKERDLLVVVYGFIHWYGSDYCPSTALIRDLDPVGGVKVSTTFLKSWIRKGWLETNEINSVRVPPEVVDKLRESGYRASPDLQRTLGELKNASKGKWYPIPNQRKDPATGKRAVKRMATITRRQS